MRNLAICLHILPRTVSALRQIGVDQNGSIAVFTGFSAFALLVVFGLAIDYNRALDLQDRLQNAADFSVLAALNPANTSSDVKASAEALFRATLSPDDAPLITNVVASVEAVGSERPHRVTVNFKADLRNSLMALSGFNLTTVGGTASADFAIRQAMRFHFLMDTSDSMGIAATDQGRNLMKNNTWDTCEFACHVGDKLALARTLGVALRIDVAKQGVQRVLDLAQQHGPNSRFGFSIRSISNSSLDVVSLTDNIPAVEAALENLEIGYGYEGQDADTFFDIALPQAAASLDSLGVGATSDLVILVTDGVQSKNRSDRPVVRPIDLEYCDMLKANGRKLAVIYTEYHEILDDHAYQVTVAEFHDEIEPRLRACASTPELFIKGKTPQSIIDAFEAVFMSVSTKTLYLSN